MRCSSLLLALIPGAALLLGATDSRAQLVPKPISLGVHSGIGYLPAAIVRSLGASAEYRFAPIGGRLGLGLMFSSASGGSLGGQLRGDVSGRFFVAQGNLYLRRGEPSLSPYVGVLAGLSSIRYGAALQQLPDGSLVQATAYRFTKPALGMQGGLRARLSSAVAMNLRGSYGLAEARNNGYRSDYQPVLSTVTLGLEFRP